ncbi:MAG: 2Fe-2S iron-sulfur cluster-binding protein, partial [Acidimicrobiia bacterium]
WRTEGPVATSYRMTVANSETVFEANEDETILDAFLRNGIAVRYGCRRGKCSTCKHYIVEGDYDNSGASAYALLDTEREEGLTLLCQTFALSDCTVELVEDAAGEVRIRPATPRSAAATVVGAERLGGALWSVRMELSTGLHPLPGQYVEVAVPGGAGGTRTYSVASAPFDVRALEIIVRAYDGGAFSGQLDDLAPGVELAVNGPYGQMFLRPAGRPAVLVGDEVGIAPMLSMVRYSGECGWPPGMRVLHVVPTEDERVGRAECSRWASGDPGFSYDTFDKVTAAVAQGITGDDVDVYVAGAPEFCDQAAFLLEARGVDANQMYVERFFPAQ